MTDFVVFATDDPVVLRWQASDGASLAQRARIHDVSDSKLIVQVPGREAYAPPAPGNHVTAEAADAKGGCLALFRGTVKSISSRVIDIRLDGTMDVIQRRTHPRARAAFSFHTAVVISAEPWRYFLAHPVDLSAGGVRIFHRLKLEPGDRFRLVFRPRPGITISPIAQVIECRAIHGTAPGHPKSGYVTRAMFVDLTDMQRRFFTRYVGWLLSRRN